MEKKDLYEKIVDELCEAGYEASFREDYHGRGYVNGPAIVTDAPPPMVGFTYAVVIVQNADENTTCFELDLDPSDLPMRWDNMGKDQMVYY